MHVHPNHTQVETESAVDGLVATHWSVSICVVCGHEHVHGERHRVTCPTCGATLNSFRLWRELQAQGPKR